MLTRVVQELCPPVVWRGLKSVKSRMQRRSTYAARAGSGDHQDLEVYWDPKMAAALETWGEGNVWNEIQFLMLNCRGRILDVGCGTGKTIEMISHYPSLEIYGCDISEFLLAKAIERGIAKERLKACDATTTGYDDDYFDCSYSIGSLEHFTEAGIGKVIAECRRITKDGSFHMVPVSRSGRNEGWLKTWQSFHNNSVGWWVDLFKESYSTVYVLDSSWNDAISVGKWFVCKRS
jgi:ubiquinone/menaquinone biosynthesis C-methylase UbiE